MEGRKNCRWSIPQQNQTTVAIPALTYVSDIWYIPSFALTHKSFGSTRTTKLLCSIQGTATRYIMGSIKGTTFDTLDVHTFIPPVDLLFHRAQFHATSRICTLPKHHPLYPLVCKVASRLVRSHQSPLHYLFHLAYVKPQLIETISPTSLCSPTYQPALKTTICIDKENAF